LQSVLVAGAGLAALEAARQAALLGHEVIFATPLAGLELGGADDDAGELAALAAALPPAVAARAGCSLLGLSGAAGDFSATIAGNEHSRQSLRCGAVVLAPPASWLAAPAPAGLDPALVRPLSALDPGALAGPPQGWLQVAVLAGVEGPLTAAAFSRALAAALALSQRPRVQVTFICGEARVSQPGGERLYRDLRLAGALMARVEPGGLAVAEDGRALSWPDALLGEQVTLAPDLVVLAEEAVADLPACLDNPVAWPAWKEIRPEWPRLTPGLTARSGLYVLGAARGTAPGDERLSEAAVAVGELHQRLGGGFPPPLVRHQDCARCLTCVRACPHGVPRHEEGRIVCAPAACLQCGLCAAACPALAIAPAGWSQAELAAGLEAGLKLTPAPALVLMACARSAQLAFAQLAAQGRVWPANLLLLPVPCASRAGSQLALKALELGAAGVLVAGCHHGNCRSLKGSQAAEAATSRLERDLLDLGFKAGLVRVTRLAGNQPLELAAALENMLGDLTD
jgi:coenzyme F420-reducing hydrogenase delta subunit/ferredoxin